MVTKETSHFIRKTTLILSTIITPATPSQATLKEIHVNAKNWEIKYIKSFERTSFQSNQ